MSIIKIIFISVLITMTWLPFNGNAMPDSVVLVGKFLDKTKNGGIFECKVLTPGAPLEGQDMFTQTYNTTIVNGQFRLILPVDFDWFDATFSLLIGDEKTLINQGNPLEVTYILHKGELINMLFRDDGWIDFSGAGATRLSCQQDIYSLGRLPAGANAAYNELYNSAKYSEAFNTYEKFLQIQLDMKRNVLKVYQDSMPSFIYDRIWLDVLGQSNWSWLYSLYIHSSSKDRAMRYVSRNFAKQLLLEMPQADTSSQTQNSAYYANSVLLKEIVEITCGRNIDSVGKVTYPEIFNAINKYYKGKMHDKLLMLSLIDKPYFKGDISDFISKSKAILSNDENKNIFIQLSTSISKGSPAFPFKLPDEKGNIVSLSDFRGKVVIADFWFNGCLGCTQIPAAMKIVYEKYASNKNVVFLSINVDRQKKWWYLGLKQGIYTIPGSLHLSLFGQGTDHPLVKYYNYNSFPQLLIIDEKGRTVSAYAPDPRIDVGRGIISIINSLL
jgi:thiol-disulfide isomerase/thioredoxin